MSKWVLFTTNEISRSFGPERKRWALAAYAKQPLHWAREAASVHPDVRWNLDSHAVSNVTEKADAMPDRISVQAANPSSNCKVMIRLRHECRCFISFSKRMDGSEQRSSGTYIPIFPRKSPERLPCMGVQGRIFDLATCMGNSGGILPLAGEIQFCDRGI
jgi:hypothetical protein